ncbi:lachesin-like isoform X2 [Panulirus ornatus]|uniref:lachesin-like isoform X2 n=1 Tax=Panulirus ornatus TaxID=150431 RepID=UPI003A877E8A
MVSPVASLSLLLLVTSSTPTLHGLIRHPQREESARRTPCYTCPYFLNTPTRVITSQGVAANLTCGVRNLVDRKVSWIRRKDLHVLTTGTFTYTTDGRFRVRHLPGSPYWTLQVDAPLADDSGLYECQVSTQPKIFRRFSLSVVVPSADIRGSRLVFMKAGSDINITCVITGNVHGSPVTWYHALPGREESPAAMQPDLQASGGGPNSGCSLIQHLLLAGLPLLLLLREGRVGGGLVGWGLVLPLFASPLHPPR